MIEYSISGSLPSLWEDFISADSVCMTISAGEYAHSISQADDGWLDVHVTEPEVTLAVAIREIAKALGVSESEIEIVQHNKALAI